ncbi:hypothetical protein SUDANB95_07906 (plasmid) [Actinosynnema sp. ALI-1.44]
MAPAPAPHTASGNLPPAQPHRGPNRVDRYRGTLRCRLEDLLGINVLQLPHRALSALMALQSTTADLLNTPLPSNRDAEEFRLQVALVHERVHTRTRPWSRVVELPADRDTRIGLADTVLRLCLDLHELTGRLHPALHVMRASTSSFAARIGQVVTLQAFYLRDDPRPETCQPVSGLH